MASGAPYALPAQFPDDLERATFSPYVIHVVFGGVPPGALSMRVAMRHKYRIKGSLCNDIVISWCCHGLSWCQMHRELKHRKKDPVVINVQAQTAIHMQPSPMMMMPAPGPYVGQPMFIPAPQ